MTDLLLVEKVARALCEADGFDPDDDVIAGQAAAFENYGPRWQAMRRSERQCGGTDYVEMAEAALSAAEGYFRPEAEPVAWMYGAEREEPHVSIKRWPSSIVKMQCWIETPLYAHPTTLPTEPASVREERLLNALCLADELLMKARGSFPLPYDPDRDAYLIVRGFTGEDHAERKHRAALSTEEPKL